MLTSYRLLGYS